MQWLQAFLHEMNEHYIDPTIQSLKIQNLSFQRTKPDFF